MRPIVQFELNEVSWRVVDWYVQRRPASALARCLAQSVTYTTVTADQGELHPWSTWPTVHRGVTNDRHGITFINQAIGTEFPPVWELLAERFPGQVGVFGSLQSCASYPAQPEKYAFYVPDTFATTPTTHPRKYEAFQSFNLRMTKMDGAVAKSIALDGSTASQALSLLRSGIPWTVAGRLAAQVVREQWESAYKTRRSVFQAPVSFHFFADALRATRPMYSTFFTNHVAGMMHRYWKHAFPEDFGHEAPEAMDAVRASNVLFGMDEADRILGWLERDCRANGAALLVASSMGQEAIRREPYFGEYRLVDPGKLFTALGFTQPWTLQLAMQPDFSFRLESADSAADLYQRLARVHASDGRPAFRLKLAGATLNVGLMAIPRSEADVAYEFRDEHGATALPPPAALGFERFSRDPGTGYHQPRGIALFWTPEGQADDSRTEVPSTALAPTVLAHFGVERPAYMPAPLEGALRQLATPAGADRKANPH